MNTAVIIISAVCVIGAAFFAAYEYFKTDRIIKKINEMLDSAIEGNFTESRFDETVMSALENRMWKYLSASEISAKKTAEEKERIKTLIADISHQTKTPISNIRLYSELLCEQELTDDASVFTEKINSQSEKLSFLINSLVKLSRLETGIITLKPKKNQVAPMLSDIEMQYSEAAAEKGLFLKVSSDDASAVFDEKWTAEAIGNIVDNAVKYTEKGGITVNVKEYEMFVCIEIHDTGTGISEEDQPKIFSRFVRLENAEDKSGVGIGLYLAREIISGENGYIKVASSIGKGSVFSVFLSKK